MPGVILAVVEQPRVAARILAGAAWLADLLGGALINVLAIRLPPEATILPTEQMLTEQEERLIRERENARIAALAETFETWRGMPLPDGTTVAWCEEEALADTVVGDWGRRSDYIVLRRPGHRDPASVHLAIHAALFDTDRPVLVVPPDDAAVPLGRHIAIAWRDDRHAVKAVLAALRCLARASHVAVLTGVREGAPQPGTPEILSEHGINAELHILPLGSGVFGELLLAQARALGADMLVMGAYAHSPLREMLLGGVTHHVLGHAELPVLMRH
jgi:nucleotide-binding universal stress UspA family protein